MEFNSSDSYFSDSVREKVPFEPSMFSSFIAHSSMFNKSDNNTTDFEKLLKELDEWRHKLTWSRTNAELACDYCGGGIRDVILAYNSIHGYISLLVCVFGSLANVLNVAVLTRRDLAAAPINRLLKWLAVADVFVMLEYIPFTIYRYLVLPGQMDFPYSWAAYLLFHMHSTQILHTASISLTLSLAVWRYIAIKYPERSHVLCTERRCSIAILSSFVLPPILCIPSYMVFDIHTTTIVENSTAIQLYHLDSDYDGKLYQTNFWVHAVIVKLLPCLVLTVLSVWLIRALYHANSRKRALKGYNTCSSTNNGTNGSAAILTEKASKRQAKYDKRTDRTTRMLLAVLLLFLITEFPQGILGLLSALLGKCFFKLCYDLFGELMDILALLNGAINFILYCCMSRQFRTTFGQLFRPKIMIKRSAGSQTDIQSTYV